MKKSAAYFVLAASLAAAGAFALQASLDLPQTRAGRAVAAYVKAFNSGEEAMKEFFLSYTSRTALERTPVAVRINRYREMKPRLGTITIKSLVEARADFVSVAAVTSEGPAVRLDFRFESVEPHGFLGLQIEAQEPGGEGGEAPPAGSAKKDAAELAAAVGEYGERLAGAGEFAGVILVAKDGKPVFERAYGFADRDKRIPNTAATKFNVGSISKSFTSRAVRLLIAEGKIDPKDTIGKFLPGYPNKDAAARVTVDHLLNMTSGIGDFFGDRYEAAAKETIRTLEDYLPLFADKPLEFEPGAKRRYSNGGYVVLGLIVAKASGRDYYDFVRDRVFKPAGMADSAWYPKDALPADAAHGYIKEGEAWTKNLNILPGRGSSAGGGYATARDLLKYVAAIGNGTLVAASQEERTTGLGIAGGAPGLNAALEWMPERGWTVVVMANMSPPAAEQVARQIRAWLPR